MTRSLVSTVTSFTEGLSTPCTLRFDLCWNFRTGGDLRECAPSENSKLHRSTIPVFDADKYGVILARTMNGKVLGNNYGPPWIMYPCDQYRDELKTPLGEAKFAWRIIGLTVE